MIASENIDLAEQALGQCSAGASFPVAARSQSMFDHGWQHRLHILRNSMLTPFQQCPGARGTDHRDAAAR